MIDKTVSDALDTLIDAGYGSDYPDIEAAAKVVEDWKNDLDDDLDTDTIVV